MANKEYCSCVMGIKFYMGLSKLHSMMIVHLQREFGNIHDPCAITVTLQSGVMLGHVEEKYARVHARHWMHIFLG